MSTANVEEGEVSATGARLNSKLKQFSLLRWENGREGVMKRSQEDEKSPLNNLGPCAHYLHGQKQRLSSLHL